MTLIADPLFYLVAVPAVLVFGMGKGGFGGSAGALAVPLMSLVVDPVMAAAVMLPTLLVMDAVAVWKFRHHFDRHHLAILLPASVIGIAAAAMLMGRMTADHMRLMIGSIAVLFCAYEWLHNVRQRPRSKPGRVSGWFWGAVSGFTSTQIHAGGIPVSIYLLPQRLDKVILVGTNALFFGAVNLMKLVPYALLGQFDRTNLATSVVLLPLAPIGVLLGYRLMLRFSQRFFYRVLYITLFLAGCRLIQAGLTGG